MSETNGDMGNGKDYEVGYRKPPVLSRWQKGRSGNPSGKKKEEDPADLDECDLGRILQAIDNEQITVKVGKRKVRVTNLSERMRRLFNRALGGDLRAARQIVSMASSHFAPDAVGDTRMRYALRPQDRVEDLTPKELVLLAKLTQSQEGMFDNKKRGPGQALPVSEAVVFRRMWTTEISFPVNGRKRRMSFCEALVRKIYEMSLDEDPGAALLLNRIGKLFPGDLPLGEVVTRYIHRSDLGL